MLRVTATVAYCIELFPFVHRLLTTCVVLEDISICFFPDTTSSVQKSQKVSKYLSRDAFKIFFSQVFAGSAEQFSSLLILRYRCPRR